MQLHFDSFFSQAAQPYSGEARASVPSHGSYDGWIAAIRSRDSEYLKREGVRVKSEFYAQSQFQNLIKLAAEMLVEQDFCTGEEYFAGQEIFILLHNLYAKYITGLSCDEKARLQWHAIKDSVQAFLDCNPDLTPSTSLEIQAVFVKVLEPYLPDCPHLAYVTKESLEKVHKNYNANQYLYAKWCYMTSLAMRPLVLESSFDELISLGSASRSLLARLCKTEVPDRFGKKRVGGLKTPIPGRYQPWHCLMRELWGENSAYCVDAISVDGERVAGTKVGFLTAADKFQLSWYHGLSFKELHQVSEEWLKKSVNLGRQHHTDFKSSVGSLMHALTQYTPWMRGSAFFSLTLNHAILLAFDKKLPHAINLIDCYALSFQRDDFVEKIYIPWIDGELTEEKAGQLLSTRAPTVTQCYHADWLEAIARGDITFLKSEGALAPPEFYFDDKFVRLLRSAAVRLAENPFCTSEQSIVGRKIFVLLHKLCAKAINYLFYSADMGRLKWSAIMHSGEAFLQYRPNNLTPSLSEEIQTIFEQVLDAYVPESFTDRNENRHLHAKWSYMTSLAMLPGDLNPSQIELDSRGAASRALFASLFGAGNTGIRGDFDNFMPESTV